VVGSAGQWDEQYVGSGVAIIVEDDLLKMWYGGGNAAYVGKIGYAQSDPVLCGVGVEDNKIKVIPTEYSLSQNYPNPFNPTTKIRYQVAATGLVSLQVYNLLGELTATLVNEVKPVGTYELIWNAANLPSGVYFYKLQSNNFIETKKMLLLK
ncbi:MAG: T9SS type A sorting domain-containing protein, partial [Ignavibacteriaceae bacterium]